MYSKRLFENILLYLGSNGWNKFETQYEGLNAYLNEHYKNINIVLPIKFDAPDTNERINDTLDTISLLTEEKKDILENLLYRFDADFHNYIIPGKDIPSVQLDLAEEIISSMRRMIYLSAQTAYEKMRNIFKDEKKSKIEISSEYVKQCKFGHTWKGSFGFTIETPLRPKSLGIFAETTPTYERKISQKIYDGMKIIQKAEELNTDSYIVDNIEVGFNKKMLKEILEIGENIKHNRIEYRTSWAPVLPVQKEYTEVKSFILKRRTFDLVEKAVSKLATEEEIYDIIFYGFPVGLKSEKDMLLDKKLEGNRFIYVKGMSEIMKQATLKLEVGYTDYLKAVHAHENHDDVRLKCKVRKRPKGWEVVELESFDLVDK
jgi:hypothetical protein